MTRVDAIRELRRLGWIPAEYETTAGANKVWLKPVGDPNESLANAIEWCEAHASVGRPYSPREEEYGVVVEASWFCEEFEAEIQNYGGRGRNLFLAFFQNSYAGLAYREGIDC